jgi:CspA family cold shock protein
VYDCLALLPGFAAARGGPVVLFGVLFREFLQMAEGTIKKLIADKGFGFIQGEKGELFFHHSAVENGQFDSLQEGQRVTYTEGRGPKGPRADAVTPV